MPPKAPQPLKRGSDLLDPEKQYQTSQSTTEVELLNLSSDGRKRRTRTKTTTVKTSLSTAGSVFDMAYDQDDPMLPSTPDLPFNLEDVSLSRPPEIPGLTVKTTQRTKRYLNSVCILYSLCLSQ